LVVGQFAKSAARLLAVAGLLFLKVAHYPKFPVRVEFSKIRRPLCPGIAINLLDTHCGVP